MSKPVFPVPEVVPQRTLTKQGYSVTEDTYRCDDCNKTFRTSQGLKYHMMHHTGTCVLTAPDRCFYLNQAYLSMFIAGLKRGKTNRSQTATDVAMVIK